MKIEASPGKNFYKTVPLDDAGIISSVISFFCRYICIAKRSSEIIVGIRK